MDVRDRQAGVAADRLVEVGQGRVELVAAEVGLAAVVIGQGVAVAEPDRVVEVGDRLARLAEGQPDLAAGDPRRRVVGRDPDRLVEVDERLVHPVHRRAGGAAERVRLGRLRVHPDRRGALGDRPVVVATAGGGIGVAEPDVGVGVSERVAEHRAEAGTRPDVRGADRRVLGRVDGHDLVGRRPAAEVLPLGPQPEPTAVDPLDPVDPAPVADARDGVAIVAEGQRRPWPSPAGRRDRPAWAHRPAPRPPPSPPSADAAACPRVQLPHEIVLLDLGSHRRQGRGS